VKKNFNTILVVKNFVVYISRNTLVVATPVNPQSASLTGISLKAF